MAAKITASQREVLQKLRELDNQLSDPRCRAYGFNPGDFGGPRAAAIARRVERKGYIVIDRVSGSHLRYRITTSGVQLLRSIEAGRPWLVSGVGQTK